MATGRVPTTANSPLTTKGDLFGYSTAPARLAVGANGETIVADNSTSTGLRYQVPVNVNPVLNSSFQVWQRGTSVAFGTYTYTADRWQAYNNGSAATASRQATNDTTNLPFIQYCARVQRNSGSANTNAIQFSQPFESINSIQFAGKTLTYSFYARKGANYSATSDALGVFVASGTGTDERVLAGYTGANNFISSSATLTSTWQRFTYTGTVATTATEIGLYFNYVPIGTAGANDYFEITGVQLEVGSVATPFKTYAGTIQGELAACQRYLPSVQASVITDIATGLAYSTTQALVPISFQVTPRVAPTGVTVNAAANFTQRLANGNRAATTAIAFFNANLNSVTLTNTIGTASLVAGNASILVNESSGTLLFTGCEL